MSSAICQNFVQNAWKKELCSNCFKSKDEHLKRAAAKSIKPSFATLTPPKNSIIRTINKKAKPKRNVNFTKELTHVIGYGGEDWHSDPGEDDDDEEEANDNNEADDECQSSEDDERELQRLTKANTDFNANSLNVSSETKKSYAQLKLGKPQYDAEGKKQSLVISVTPFGEEKKSSLGLNKSHIPIIAKAKDPIIENKNNIVLTSYTSKSTELKEEKSLLEEITETLEKSKNPIQIITRKKTQKDIVLAIPEKTQIDEPKLVTKNAIPAERKNGLSRNVVIKREEKPIVYQSSMGKIELSAKKTIYSKAAKEDNTDDSSNTSSSDDASIDGEKTAFSREQVGEPDGKADSDNSNEAPSLPLTSPPALDTPTVVTTPSEKPKVPTKPSTIMIRKNPHQFIQQETNVLTSFMSEAKPTCQLVKRDSNGSADIVLKSTGVSNFFLNNNKRKAPKPPSEDIGIYTKNSINAGIPSDCPVVREKEKRERASSCSPKLRNDGTDSVSVCDDPQGCENSSIGSDSLDSSIPAPAPRRSLSLSTDSLANGEAKKDKNRPRFSLKKFLRISSGKELPKAQLDVYRSEQDLRPQPKPRLEIVHPLDLSGRSVQVLNKDHQQDNKVTEIYLPRVQIVANPASLKPSPPPRGSHLLNEDAHKPVLPHPPKSAEILTKQRQVHLNNIKNNRPKTADSVYANIGEVRSAIAPNKPQRTASMREQPNVTGKENVYEYVTTIGSNRSSSPEADSSTTSSSGSSGKLQVQLRPEGVAAEYYAKGNYAQQMPRAVSLTYCGSETESEIYAPYSYYGSESEIAEDENDWNNSTGRTHKLRSRKGRSIVHRNLEDNYGAVVIANHEALAQVLENIQHNNNTFIPPHLRPLKSSPTLRFTDFTLTPNTSMNQTTVVVGRYTFRPATYCNQPVTLSMLCSAGGGPARGGTGGALLTTSMLVNAGIAMPAVVEFSDVVPREELVCNKEDDGEKEIMVQATIAVLPLLHLTTLQLYGAQIKPPSSTNNVVAAVGRLDDICKDAVFVLLQLVNALKTLQAQGIEELPLSLDTFVLAKDADRDVYYRLYVLQGSSADEPSSATMITAATSGSLCSCAASALCLLRPAAGRLYPLLHRLLDAERAVCLTQVRSVLEFSLWGPSDVTLGNSVRERELALQRWLDLQRATVLHGLVCTKVQLTVYEECHLLFLVRSNAKMLCDASLLLDSVTAATHSQTKA